MKELRVLAAALYAKLDDWIIFGIKNENDLVYEAVKKNLLKNLPINLTNILGE